MAFMVVLGIIAVLVLVYVFALAREPGPTATDVAIGYERAWDRLDFPTIWTLSGGPLREGLAKVDFVAIKKAAYAGQPELRRLVGDVEVDDAVIGSQAARVITRLHLRDGSVASNEIRLERARGSWAVVGYALHPVS